jgi:hypothetical protein
MLVLKMLQTCRKESRKTFNVDMYVCAILSFVISDFTGAVS